MVVAHRESVAPDVVRLKGYGFSGAIERLDRLRGCVSLAPYWRLRPAGYDEFQLDGPLMGTILQRELPATDLINLHWVAGMLDFASLPRLAQTQAPIVWTLHDMLPLTGGCHYDDGCARYLERCGECPQLGSRLSTDLSAAIFGRKKMAFEQIPRERLHFVSPSRWLAEQARRSPICRSFPVSVIPNGLDLDLFAPDDRLAARAALGLPQDRAVVLFVAQELGSRRKGSGLLLECLEGLRDLRTGVMLVSMGRAQFASPPGFDHRHFPHTDDDRLLARLYAAADVLVIPSLQDNLPNTMLEAMACGTPVVGFAVGGIPDMVKDGETGLLAPPRDVVGLRAALRRIVGDPERARAMGRRARERVMAECSPALQAGRYRDLFESVLRGARAAA
jgi:glycosyltransferase involved in cell wall biosynthesis